MHYLARRQLKYCNYIFQSDASYEKKELLDLEDSEGQFGIHSGRGAKDSLTMLTTILHELLLLQLYHSYSYPKLLGEAVQLPPKFSLPFDGLLIFNFRAPYHDTRLRARHPITSN